MFENFNKIMTAGAKERASAEWPRPIPVSERLPEPDKAILGFNTKTGRWHECSYAPDACGDDDAADCYKFQLVDEVKNYGNCITHWMPLPPAP